MRHVITALSLATCISHAYAEPDQELRQYLYQERVEEAESTSGTNFEQALDAKLIIKEWQSNQARAQLKFSKPGLYYGKLNRVILVNGTANFVLNGGTSTEIIVILFDYQLGPWKKTNGKWTPSTFQNTIEFAADYNKGRDFYFQCRRIEFSFKPYLKNCLAFPMNVVKES
ncbi:hypothetical protein [Pseudomonas japonica]|uniref:hypothetical protein n=1 Tax=Pseudomonas japonica TaxID=256466 RepID=UPI003A892789